MLSNGTSRLKPVPAKPALAWDLFSLRLISSENQIQFRHARADGLARDECGVVLVDGDHTGTSRDFFRHAHGAAPE